MRKSNHSGNSLSEAYQTVDIDSKRGIGNKILAFMGPAYLISVGYMDPGNWATDIAGGSTFGYKLIWVLLMSNLIALLLQSLSSRLGIVSGRDLAQASRETYSPIVNFMLYILAEIAIAACDLAEVLGMAIGLQLLCGLPLIWGVSLTVLDTLLLLFLINYGIRKLEAFIITLIALIGVSFLIEMFFAKPVLADILQGFIPTLPTNPNPLGSTSLYIAIGIIGATVMPHNLYLHSSLVQTRKFERTPKGILRAIKYNILDSTIALNLAFFVNCAILVLAAATFFHNGMFDVADISQAHSFLAPLLGSKLAPIIFAVALIVAGQSSTITGTLAGQIVMEGFLNLRIQPWLRRLITRLLAIIPALLTIIFIGEQAIGGLLILSQVILSIQLGFAIIPLIHFVSDKHKMGTYVIKLPLKILSWLCAIIIIGLNAKLMTDQINDWITGAGDHAYIYYLTVVPIAILSGILLLFITIRPLLIKTKLISSKTPHGIIQKLDLQTNASYNKIAVTIDFSFMDSKAISAATKQGGKDADYILIHVVETAGAIVMGNEIDDLETLADKKQLQSYLYDLNEMGYKIQVQLGYGNPKKAIPEIVNKSNANLLVMGAHGHHLLKDIIFGTTLDSVRHNVKIPVLIVKG
jgi:manganese transport protein